MIDTTFSKHEAAASSLNEFSLTDFLTFNQSLACFQLTSVIWEIYSSEQLSKGKKM